MASNITIPASGTGTATPIVATEDVAGVHHQYVKMEYGGTGAATPVTATAPLPVGAKTPLTGAAPTFASVGVASAQALAANANRKGLVLINTSGARISIALGAAAVLNSGITLMPNGGTWTMTEHTLTTAAINAIAGAAASNLAIQEYT